MAAVYPISIWQSRKLKTKSLGLALFRGERTGRYLISHVNEGLGIIFAFTLEPP